MKRNLTIGLSVVAGAALFEAALIPGLAIGAAAILAPKYLPRFGRRLQRQFKEARVQPAASEAVPSGVANVEVRRHQTSLRLSPKQALIKTVTFRIIVTSLDFGVNYVVIGELATAAGLSGFSQIVGPFFYFIHEILWNKSSSSEFLVQAPHLMGAAKAPFIEPRRFAIPRALAKTITFRTIATTMDFTTNYVVVGDILTAAGLSASGFILGPFIYFGHEKLWDKYGTLGDRPLQLPNAAASISALRLS